MDDVDWRRVAGAAVLGVERLVLSAIKVKEGATPAVGPIGEKAKQANCDHQERDYRPRALPVQSWGPPIGAA